jgi:type IV pilus assembly protein PilC
MILAICYRLPVIGGLILAINLNNFFRTAGMLMSFGIPLQDALKLAIDVIGVGKIRRNFEKILGQITRGERLSDNFMVDKLLDPTDYGLIFAAEQSGNLAKSFEKIGEIYGEKVQNRLAFLTTLIEPAIIVFLAVVVGIVVVSVFLPMMGIMENMHP